MLTRVHCPRPRSAALLLTTSLTSITYIVLAIRFGLRIGSSDLNSSARVYFLGVLATTVVLYAVALGTGISQRGRAEAPVPTLLASLFGIFVCLVFYGP